MGPTVGIEGGTLVFPFKNESFFKINIGEDIYLFRDHENLE